ncbi:hypothetical protein QFC20_006155 [Naganishia adeliensis]|uniref:Uncharacterized protein n=1 Tax=Naganishia adeliensis TaxID=92952 RepID=A0ACC2VEI9_9TREE|nr:hypothetical protein QFC20_006155 [Naganishia adeliensis]
MDLAISSLEPSKLVQSLDFEGKGFGSPQLVSYSRLDGKEARLLVKAVYHGPRPGWPLLERKTLYDLAQKSKDQDLKSAARSGKIIDGPSKSRAALCLADKDPEYPVRVLIRIALSTQPGACEDMLKVVRVHSQLYANDYPAFELPVALWRTTEGIWGVVVDDGAVPLPTWWEQQVQPQIQSSERRWKIGSWRKGEERDGDAKVAEAVEGTRGKLVNEDPATYKKKARFSNAAVDSDTASDEKLHQPEPEPSSSHHRRPSDHQRPSDVREMIGTTESPKIDGTLVNTATRGLQDDHKIEISQSQKEEWAARIQQQKQDMQWANGTSHVIGDDDVVINISPSAKRIGVDEEEEEAMIIDKGWLQAVNILIQLADIILSLHERRICMVVCRPDFFSVFDSRPFTPRSAIPSGSQAISLQLTHLGVIVQMPGYQNGKLVGNMNSDFDGDKVVAQGPGSAMALTDFGSNGSRDDE